MLAVACAVAAVTMLSVTAPAVVLDDVSDATGADLSQLGWIVSIYALLQASLQLTAGALADAFGRRRILLGALGVFAAGAALVAVAAAPAVAIVGRALQGAGAAGTFAASLAMLVEAVAWW